MGVSVSYGGGYYGGGSSYDASGMMGESSGLLGTLNSMLSGLPGWLSITIKALLLLLVAALVGWLIGQIVGRVLFPNPEKPSFLNQKQKFIVLGAIAVTFIMVIMALRPVVPKDDTLPVDGFGDSSMTDGMGDGDDALDLPAEGDAVPEEELNTDDTVPEGDDYPEVHPPVKGGLG